MLRAQGGVFDEKFGLPMHEAKAIKYQIKEPFFLRRSLIVERSAFAAYVNSVLSLKLTFALLFKRLFMSLCVVCVRVQVCVCMCVSERGVRGVRADRN